MLFLESCESHRGDGWKFELWLSDLLISKKCDEEIDEHEETSLGSTESLYSWESEMPIVRFTIGSLWYCIAYLDVGTGSHCYCGHESEEEG